MRTGKQEVPIYWHPKVDKSLRNTVDDIGSFFTEGFRDTFEITQEQSELIKNALSTDNIPEKHSSKFFKVKKIWRKKNHNKTSPWKLRAKRENFEI